MARADSSLVNRSIDVLMSHAMGYQTLWDFGTPGKFAVMFDSTPALFSGFVTRTVHGSVHHTARCYRYGRIALVGWRPLVDSVGIEALVVTVPDMPGRVRGTLAKPGTCTGDPDEIGDAVLYRIVDREIYGPSHVATGGTFAVFAGGIRSPRCVDRGARRWVELWAITCAEQGFRITLDARVVPGDSLYLKPAGFHTLEIRASDVPGKRFYVNCADPRSVFLCVTRQISAPEP
jgi:hypothetical protein